MALSSNTEHFESDVRQWLIDLPFSPSSVKVRRFTSPFVLPIPPAESSADAIRRAAFEAVSAHDGDDALEKAWRAVNGIGANEAGKGVMGVLRSPCAVVTTGEGPLAGKRELWLFEIRGPNGSASDQYHNEALEGLTPVQGGTDTFKISDLLSCSSHGRTISCLAAKEDPTSACAVTWQPGRMARAWKLFEGAVLEKLAWRTGQRVCAGDRRDTATPSAPGLNLRPLATQHLLLSLDLTYHPSRRIRSPPPQSVTLYPSYTSALRIATFDPSSAQLGDLERSFTQSFGPRWKSRQGGESILSHGNGEAKVEWAVYWVGATRIPIQPAADGTASPTAVDPARPSTDQGVLVVWPNTLVSTGPPVIGASSTSRPRKRPIAAVTAFPEASDLMGIASGVFDFLSTYKEPSPPKEPSHDSDEPVGLVNTDLPTPQTGPSGSESTPKIPFDPDIAAPGVGVQAGDIGMDEDDDLFASKPNSPVLRPDLLSRPSDEPLAGTADDFDDLFGASASPEGAPAVELDKDVDMESPKPEAIPEPRGGYAQRYDAYAGADEANATMITDDDFAFLDSPADEDDEGEGERKEVNDDQSLEVPEMVETVDATAVPPVLPAGDSGEGLTTEAGEAIDGDHLADVDAAGGNAAASELSKPPGSPVLAKPRRSSAVTGASSLPQPEGEKTAASAEPSSGHDLRPLPRPAVPPDDLVPSIVSPLDIARPSTLPNPIYTFPTPAPTPEAHNLRDGLIERLRQAKRQKGDIDYALTWHVDDDQTEAEGEYDDSGAPPTPMSESGTVEDEISERGGLARRAEDGETGKVVVEWKGLRCLGAEMLWMAADPKVWEAVSRPWNEEWAAGTGGPIPGLSRLPSPPTSPAGKTKALSDDVDMDRIAREIIANRYYRARARTRTTRSDTASGLLGAGQSLSDIITPSQDGTDSVVQLSTNSSTILLPCNVHAGFAGNVMRLSIAGTKYWRQLGLSPVGGEKEVEAIVITISGTGLERAAARFMAGMSAVWEQHRLGKHIVSGEAGEGGVLQVQASVLDAKIREITRGINADTNVVIYLLLDHETAMTPLVLQVLGQTLPQTVIIHTVLASAIQPRQLPDLAFDVYNRIPRLLHQLPSASHAGLASPTYLQYPSFTLAPDQSPKPELTLQWPLRSYDILNRWRYVHAAYSYDPESGLVAVFIIDAEGENYEVKTFRAEGMKMSERLGKIWKFCVGFAEIAAIEWRMTLTRVGSAGKDELDSWGRIIGGAHVTLLVHDPASSTTEPTLHSINTVPVPAPVISDPNTRISDNTLAAHTSTFPHRIPLILAGEGAGGTATVYPTLIFTLTIATSPSTTATAIYHVISHKPAPGKEEEKLDEVLSREFQRMVYLGRERFGFMGGAMGVHVAAVEAVGRILGDLESQSRN